MSVRPVAVDEWILEGAVEFALKNSPYETVRNLECHVVGGRVVVAGDVPSFHCKQLALSIASRVVDPALIDDAIRVGLR